MKSCGKIFFVFVLFAVCSPSLGAATFDPAAKDYSGHKGKTVYVSKNGDNSDGSCWKKAFHSIQAALDAVPDDKGGHRIIIRPDTYAEANLQSKFKGAKGSYNEMVGDFDGRHGSGKTGWVVIDSGAPAVVLKNHPSEWMWQIVEGDPAGQWGLKSIDWWGTTKCNLKFSAINFDRWIFRNMYYAGAEGFGWDLTCDKGAEFSVITEDCVATGRFSGLCVGGHTGRAGEPVVARRCHFMCFDWWGDAAGVYVRAENKEKRDVYDAVFEDCTIAGPDNALQCGNPGFDGYTKVLLKNCRLFALNFSQPRGQPSTGIIYHTLKGPLLHVDLEDTILAGYKVFGSGGQQFGCGKRPDGGPISYSVKGKVQAYVQFEQNVPEGIERLRYWPVKAFESLMPQRFHNDRIAKLRGQGADLGVDMSAFHDELVNVRLVPGSQPADVSVGKPKVADMDLPGMARWALRALKNNPRPHMNHECRFSMDMLQFYPGPTKDQHDPITAGDTENRMDWEFGYMKEMCGDTSADDIAKGVRKRILGHLRDDGLCWITTGAFARLPGLWATHWTTGKLLISFCDDYRRTGDEKLRGQCRKMFEAMIARANWVDGRAYCAGGNSCWNEKGWAITDATPYSPAMLLEAVVTYYETFGDKEALDFAIAFAKGEMAQDQWANWIMKDPGKLTPEQKEQAKLTSTFMKIWPTAPLNFNLGVRPDGSFEHHSHMRGHSGWGMAHLASITRDPELVDWTKRLLDFFLRRGTDWGWIPESMTVVYDSETCAVADVISMSAYMAQTGHPEYWDTVERFVRNYIREAQFFFTPEYEKYYCELHGEENGKKGLEMAREFEGGFQGRMGLNDHCDKPKRYDMMGCCVPEGMRSIYTAWKFTVQNKEGGVFVNMCFDRETEAAKVTSFLPFTGRMTVEAKVAKDFYLRPPTWALKSRIKAYVNKKPVPLLWRDSYVFFDNARQGDELTITYPLVTFVQKQVVPELAAGIAGKETTITWLGNTVMKLEPRGPQLPLFQKVPRPLPPLPKE
ncbi:MAG: glycoside hydrolase family 127 protein [Pirellulales bacterium]|nr:glycoside hydrolase family 127 protein [Pirellulales bacterium]